MQAALLSLCWVNLQGQALAEACQASRQKSFGHRAIGWTWWKYDQLRDIQRPLAWWLASLNQCYSLREVHGISILEERKTNKHLCRSISPVV